MRHQQHELIIQRRTLPFIVDEDIGIPTRLIDEYRSLSESGPSGPSDPRALLLSMSEYDKAQDYNQYDYQPSTRPEQAQDYTSFAAAHPQYTHEYGETHTQAASNLAHASALPFLATGQAYAGPHDHSHYYAAAPPQYAAATTASTYLDVGPRQLPDILSFSPSQGSQGIRLTVRFQSPYDLEAHPAANVVIMFGHKRCDSVLSKTSLPNSPYQYVIQANAPDLSSTSSESPQVSLALALGGSVAWQAPTVDVGLFTYLNDYELQSPQTSRKRKLSFEASERRSPAKKASYAELSRSGSQNFYTSASPALTQPTLPAYAQSRRFSQPEYNYPPALPRVQTQQYYAAQPASARARLQTEHSPANYEYYSSMPSASIKETSVVPAARTAQLLPSPATSTNPPLIRTSTLHHSPPTPGLPVSATQAFNPYAMYPANSKAMLKIDGDLNSMVEHWTETEWEAKRRLVQFQRSQQASVITATFEPVTLEERAPNSICVSCIWWEERQECYVTSVDTIQLLESLVAVRFTVEEKNRIRRNLEGFRPATVSKTKADSEDFFKLIMGFPAPKPRNIEKDVKVFPWRILITALKKIIGKYSASYSSTAGALHATPAGSSYAAARLTDSGIDQRNLASPRSTSSSVTSHGRPYATTMSSQAPYMPHTATELSAGLPNLRLSVPQAGQASSWYPSSAHHYGSANTDLSATGSTPARTPQSWDYTPGLAGYGMATTPQQYHYGSARIPSMLGQSQQVSGARFIPLHDYEHPGQPDNERFVGGVPGEHSDDEMQSV